jgi:hypothetical protein
MSRAVLPKNCNELGPFSRARPENGSRVGPFLNGRNATHVAMAWERKPWHGHFSTRYPQQRVYFGIARSNRLRFSLEETWRLSSFATISKSTNHPGAPSRKSSAIRRKARSHFKHSRFSRWRWRPSYPLCGLKIWEMTKPTTKIKKCSPYKFRARRRSTVNGRRLEGIFRKRTPVGTSACLPKAEGSPQRCSCLVVGPVEVDTICSLWDRGGCHARSTKRH